MRRRFAITATRTTDGTVGTVLVVVLELVGVVVALGLLIDFGSSATPAPAPRTSSRRPTTTRGHAQGLGLGPVAALRTLRGTAALGPVAVRLIGVTIHPRTRLLLGGGIRLGRVRVELLS
ncbi:hypothetical protein OG864_35145 [Streptomyces sp. NBC_00124]|uniref:hypothetical protein n=1 Tax=Streptomyces sp. NBC_00124 TaxID=2975662 RepID=UPI0022556B38|nr:hypothetical protein [Streptomyces sp. NBC_00124]MCX5363920.1 hypothetical protein [Streptomyces sp. NBC_00124]